MRFREIIEDIDDETKKAIDKYQQSNTVGKTSRAFYDIEDEYFNIRELALDLIKNGLDPYTAYYKASEKMQFDPAMVFDWMGSEFKDEGLEDYIPVEYERDWIKRAELGMTENFDDGKKKGKELDILRKFVRSQREAPDQVLYQMMMAPDTYGHEASDFVRSWYEYTKEENGLDDVDSALEMMVDELGLNENFADGKKKGKSRPGRVKRSGASCKGSVTDLRKRAKKYSGERGRMYHWCANMKGGKKKKK